ncbi:H(+)-transporting V1 sector ATPase subunit H [Dispira simplex]|nr:H(+)-transporting V1 sector ATPase subunit H [Dispira simplex]
MSNETLLSPSTPQPSVATASADLANLDLGDSQTIPTVLIVNGYFEEVTDNIRERPMPWEGYQRASLITESELVLLRNYGPKQSVNGIDEARRYVDLFLGLMMKLSRMDALQYILVAMGDVVSKYPEVIEHLKQLAVEHSPLSPVTALSRCLNKEDTYLNLKSAKLTTELLNASSSSFVNTFDYSELLLWLNRQLVSDNPNVVDVSVQILQGLLKLEKFRTAFYNNQQAMRTFMKLFETYRQGNPQMLYQLTFCVWLLSFDRSISETLNKQYDVIGLLVDIAKTATKEKLVRIIMATFKNMLVMAPEANVAAMLVVKLLNFCDNLASRKWTDGDIKDDIDFIVDELTERFQKMTTWDEYASELVSGRLGWTPSHTSEAFWKLHASNLAENNGQWFSRLHELLNSSDDPIILAVAAHDIGQFAKHYSPGKKMVQESGAKQRIMELMTHGNPDVRYQALVAVQILMAHAWE